MRFSLLLLKWALLHCAMLQTSQEKTSQILRILSPQHESIHHTGSVTLILDINKILPSGSLVCIDVSWDKGRKSICRSSTETSWTMRGLEDGNYLVVAQLRDSDSIYSTVLAEDRANFDIVIPTIELSPRIFISFPTGNGRVFSDAAAEISFYTTNFGLTMGTICLTANLLQPEKQNISPANFLHESQTQQWRELIHQECVSPQVHSWPIGTFKSLSPGHYEIIIRLHGVDGQPLSLETSPFATASTSFFVAAPPQRSIIPHITRLNTSSIDHLEAGANFLTFDGSRETLRQEISPTYTIDRRIHVAIISARVRDRYEEALVMIKSMLFNWRPPTITNKLNVPIGLVLHMIVDERGAAFFYEKFSILISGLPAGLLSVQYHDYKAVCVAPLNRFLTEFDVQMSSHYSGAAGYCRLFMPRYFRALRLEAFMAIESDQLFFADVTNLWLRIREMDERTNSTAFIAAPEMYQPWQDGRPGENRSKQQKMKSKEHFNLDDQYHGNGIIGGIMLFNLTTMWAAKWEDRWKGELIKYIQSSGSSNGEKWVPKLNDQDIFNAILSRQPQWMAILSCEWNLQQHAFMNTNRLCSDRNLHNLAPDTSTLNCASSIASEIFVCPKPPAVVHFMSQSYLTGDPSYYGSFWAAFAALPMRLVREPFAAVSRERRRRGADL